MMYNAVKHRVIQFIEYIKKMPTLLCDNVGTLTLK